MAKIKKVIILGAGFVGLRLGDLLSRHGIEVELIEEKEEIGGMVGSFSKTFDGDTYIFDYGPHLFFRDYQDAYRELTGDELQYIKGTFSMMVEGKIFPYPLRILSVLKNLPLHILIKAGMEVLYNRFLAKKREAENLKDYFVSRFGTYLFEKFYAPYIVKSTGLQVNRTAVEWASERTHVTGNSLQETVIKRIKTVLFGQKNGENLASSDMMTAFYPVHGAGKIGEAMSHRIQKNGGVIHLASPCKKIAIKDGKVESVSYGTDGKTAQGDHVISTIPLPSLIKSINPEVTSEIRQAADSLKFRHLILMYLIIDKPQILEHIEVFFPDESVIFKRIYEPKTLSAAVAPSHRTSLCLEICCREDNKFTDQDLFKQAMKNLEDHNILQEKDVLHYFTKRLPFSYPIYHRGFATQRQNLLDYTGTIKNLTSIGRQGLFQYHAMTNECMAMADTLVKTILAEN